MIIKKGILHMGIRFTKMDMCISVYDYQKKNLCISATLKSCVLALDKASASQVLATKLLHISPHLSHLRILASLQITFAYAAAEQNIKAKSPPQTQTRQQYDGEETNY